MSPTRLFVLLFGLSGILNAAEPVTWKIETSMGGQIFPSLVYAMANLKTETVTARGRTFDRVPADMAPIQAFAKTPIAIVFNITGAAPGRTATIRILPNSLMEGSSVTINLPPVPAAAYRHPLAVSFRYQNLANIQQSAPINISVEVSINGGPAQSTTKTLTVRPINDCPLWAANSFAPDHPYDLSWMFAAYVNEDHPLIDSVLKSALSTNIVSSFDGYQSKDIDQVRNQIRAVWTALCLRGVKYSSIATNADRSTAVVSQSVRLFDRALNYAQANCVDGSVLIASILQKIGLDMELVHIPGHMFVRIWLDDQRKQFIGLETTLMGDGFPLRAGSTREQAIAVADNSYVQAWRTGNDEFNKNIRNFNGPPNSDYKIISIGEARNRGIIPIPSSSIAIRGGVAPAPQSPAARGRASPPQSSTPAGRGRASNVSGQ